MRAACASCRPPAKVRARVACGGRVKIPIPGILHEKPPEIRVWMKPDSANGGSCGRPVIGCDSQQQQKRRPAANTSRENTEEHEEKKRPYYYYSEEVWVYLADPFCVYMWRVRWRWKPYRRHTGPNAKQAPQPSKPHIPARSRLQPRAATSARMVAASPRRQPQAKRSEERVRAPLLTAKACCRRAQEAFIRARRARP